MFDRYTKFTGLQLAEDIILDSSELMNIKHQLKEFEGAMKIKLSNITVPDFNSRFSYLLIIKL